MRIVITSDHAAMDLKQAMVEHLKSAGMDITDCNPQEDTTLEYPDHALSACKMLTEKKYNYAILLCGTGAGMCMAANKLRGIRAVVCSEPYTARLAREHNNANVLCIGARIVGHELALNIAESFLSAKFLGGRHTERVNKIMKIEDLGGSAPNTPANS